MKAETQIILNKFQPRPYQIPILDAYFNKGYKRIIALLPRRAGKDVCVWNLAIRACLSEPMICYYILPTFAMARRILWDSMLSDGTRFLDFIPKELIETSNTADMKIRFTNGSLLQLAGSDNIDALVGTNAKLLIYSEFALQDPRAYHYLRPIVVANGGKMLFVSTPRGKNHMFDMWQIAQNNPHWFSYKMTVEETKHIPLHEIEKERAEGLMSDDLIEQEYYCSWLGQEGAYYTKYLDKMRLEGRLTTVPHETGFQVHTAWDLGYGDNCVVIWFQVIGAVCHVINYYSNNKHGLEHYVKVIKNYGDQYDYNYGKHWGPHDLAVHDFGSGLSRIEKAKALGLKFETRKDDLGRMKSALPNLSLEDGIEAVRSSFSRMWIDDVACADLIKCLENYRQEYDSKLKIYKDKPLHNHWSHGADAFRYLVLSLSKCRDGMTADELNKRWARVQKNHNGVDLPDFYRDDNR